LTLWFAASLIALAGADHATVVGWLKSPLVALLMVLQLTALFSHLALGLGVVIEDYLHSGARIPVLLAVRFACFALAVTGILATLRIALTG
jgi:succinate dehydrogenase / fumarate reductase membrane anchor subunit